MTTSKVTTYYSYDLMTLTPLTEMPFTGVTWSRRVGTPGNFSGNLKLSDLYDPNDALKVANLNAVLDASIEGKRLLIVDEGGIIKWAGITTGRPYDSKTHVMQVTAMEAWHYFTQRLQALDYTTAGMPGPYWTDATQPADPVKIAAQIVHDALLKPNTPFASMGISITENPPVPTTSYIVQSYPLATYATVDSLVTTLATMGFGSSPDFSIEWQWSAGSGSKPIPTFTLVYPRMGRPAGTTGLVIDTSDGSYTWATDATQQAQGIVGQASLGIGVEYFNEDTVPFSLGFPRLEALVSYANMSGIAGLTAATNGDIGRLEWPIMTPTITVPMYAANFGINDFNLGDDMQVVIPPDERFPNGLGLTSRLYMRCIGVDAAPVEEGLSEMTLTFNMPPSAEPTPPPPF